MDTGITKAAVEPATAPDAVLLVVDDDEHVRRALRRVLKRISRDVLEAPDGATALVIPLFRPEEEDLVLDDRSADVAAESVVVPRLRSI